jgi:hypothetical protein
LFADCSPTDDDWAVAVEVDHDPSLFRQLEKQIQQECDVKIRVQKAYRCRDTYLVCTSIGDTRIMLSNYEINALPVSKLTSELRARLEIAGMHRLGFTRGWLRDDLLVTYQPNLDNYLIGAHCQTTVSISALHVELVPKHLVLANMNGSRMQSCSTPMSPGHNWVKMARCGRLYGSPGETVRERLTRMGVSIDGKSFDDAIAALRELPGELDFEQACDLRVNGTMLHMRTERGILFINGVAM